MIERISILKSLGLVVGAVAGVLAVGMPTLGGEDNAAWKSEPGRIPDMRNSPYIHVLRFRCTLKLLQGGFTAWPTQR